RRWRFETDQLYVKDVAEMAAAFAHVPEAVANTVEVARRCEFELRHRQQFPVYQVPAGETREGMLDRLARQGLDERLNERRTLGWSPVRERAYEERLALELGVITAMGFAGYFLILADFINWAKAQGIPVGPGRGSAAGSLVAYTLRITDLDPIEHGLLFERFLNPERKQMPDIDVDFCFVRRDEVIRYVREKYGADHVAQIITFGTLKGKAAIKDVGRVLDFTFAETDRIAKLYPEPKQGKDFPLEQALEMEPRLRELRDSGERERRLFDLALRLEGLLRHASTIGVFQLESGGIRRMLTQLRPSCFADLVAVLALYRPGPLDAKLDDGRTMAEVFIQRKCGKEPVRYLHPALEPLLADT